MLSSELANWKMAVVPIAILVFIFVIPAVATTMDNTGHTDSKFNAQIDANNSQASHSTLSETKNTGSHTPNPTSDGDSDGHQDTKDKTKLS